MRAGRLPARALLAALVPLLAHAPPARAQPAAPDAPIVVGVLADLTGPDALGPQDAVDGFRLGMKQLTQRLGNQEARMVTTDAGAGVDSAIAAARRLLARDHPQFVLAALSPAAFAAVAPVVADQHVFLVNLGRLPEEFAGAGCSPWVFDLAGPDAGMDEAAGVQMERDKVERLAVIAPDSPLTAQALDALKRGYTGQVVAVIVPHHGAATFTAELARLRALKPGAVFDLLTGGENVAFIRALQEAGLRARMPLYAPAPGFARPFLPAMGAGGLGAVTLGSWAVGVDNPQSRKLVGDFEAEYGRVPGIPAAVGYDAAGFLDAALKAAKGRTDDADKLRKALRNAAFDSVRGAFRFDTNQGPVQSYLARTVARDPRGRLTDQLVGVVAPAWRNPDARACPMRWVPAPPPPPSTEKPVPTLPGLPPPPPPPPHSR